MMSDLVFRYLMKWWAERSMSVYVYVGQKLRVEYRFIRDFELQGDVEMNKNISCLSLFIVYIYYLLI